MRQSKHRMAIDRELFDYLTEPLTFLREGDQEQCRLALIEFLQRLDYALKKRWPVNAYLDDHNYVCHLYWAQNMLVQCDYYGACHELVDVIHCSVGRQILINIKAMIQPYIEGGNSDATK